MIGIPLEEWPPYKRWSDAILQLSFTRSGGSHAEEAPRDFSAVTVEMDEYVGEMIEREHGNPQDDLFARLIGPRWMANGCRVRRSWVSCSAVSGGRPGDHQRPDRQCRAVPRGASRTTRAAPRGTRAAAFGDRGGAALPLARAIHGCFPIRTALRHRTLSQSAPGLRSRRSLLPGSGSVPSGGPQCALGFARAHRRASISASNSPWEPRPGCTGTAPPACLYDLNWPFL